MNTSLHLHFKMHKMQGLRNFKASTSLKMAL